MNILSKLFGRKPYYLDTSVSMEVDGVTLYQLVAATHIRWPQKHWKTHGSKIAVRKGERGGWVPSLDVLEVKDGAIPWLRSKSMVTSPDARLRGALYLQDTQWKSTGVLQAPTDKVWGIYDCEFTGNSSVTLIVPPANSLDAYDATYCTLKGLRVHDSVLEGPLIVRDCHIENTTMHSEAVIDIRDSELRHSQLINRTPHQIAIERCQWDHVDLQREHVSNTMHILHAHWSHVQYHQPQEVLHTPDHSISNSQLTNVRCITNDLSHSVLHHAPSESEPEFLTTPPSPYYQADDKRFFVPVIQMHPEQHTPEVTHFVWYQRQEGSPPTPLAVYDTLHQRSIFLEELPTYIAELETHLDSPSRLMSAMTLQWWQWQTVLGLQPQEGQPWVYSPCAIIVQDANVSFAP